MTREPTLPVRYVPAFLPPSQATALFERLSRAIPWEQKHLTLYGKMRPIPRLTCWFGESPYEYSGVTNLPLPWTPEVEALRAAAETESGARFNSCLANLYRSGRDSVSWHADNEPELGPDPTIASVSLGTPRTFRLKHVATGVTQDLQLAGGSLLVMDPPCQAEWVHSVPKRQGLTGERINLTFRWFTAGSPMERPLTRNAASRRGDRKQLNDPKEHS